MTGLSEVGASVHKQSHTQTARESEGNGAFPQTDANVAYGMKKSSCYLYSFCNYNCSGRAKVL